MPKSGKTMENLEIWGVNIIEKIILETLVAIFLRMADGYTGFFVPYEI